MNTLGVVVVLYRPSGAEVDHLLGLTRFAVDLVVVDNSPIADEALHQRLIEAGMTMVTNRNRGGLAGGLNRGVETAIDRGHDLVMLLDQDSEFDDDFFDRMADAARSMGSAEFILGARVWETTSDQYLEVSPPPTGVVVPEAPAGCWPADDLITSGTTISAAAYRRLGPFREDLIIEAIDSEYSLRAHRANVGLYVVHGAVIRQIRGDSVVRFGLPTTRLGPSRRYYLARNATAVRREYGLGAGAAIKMVAKETVKVVLFEDRKAAKVAAFAVGVADGMRARMGALEETHPRFAAYASR